MRSAEGSRFSPKVLDLCENGLEVLCEDPTTCGDGGVAGGLKLAGREEQKEEKNQSQTRGDCSLTSAGQRRLSP